MTLRVLQVSAQDLRGGAARNAWVLHRGLRARGVDARMLVGWRDSDDPHVQAIPRPFPDRAWREWATPGGVREALRAIRSPAGLVGAAAEVARRARRLLGHEEFEYPASRPALEAAAAGVDLVHCHNLHNRYFDLRALPALSRRLPVVVTLHDMWLLTGHCGHAFACERWRSGCGRCPALDTPPEVRRDATAYNLRRKAAILRRCRLHVTAPCRWLLDLARRSILGPAIVGAEVIPYGIDLEVFRPGDRDAARAESGLPGDRPVLLCMAAARTTFKEFDVLRAALGRLDRPALCVALGDVQPTERHGQVELRFMAGSLDPARVAAFHRAADVFVQPARADTFPNVVLEALACGIAVVASAVGGIPEQVREGETGRLYQQGDPVGLAAALAALLDDGEARARLGAAAAADAAARFGRERFVDDVLAFYGRALGS